MQMKRKAHIEFVGINKIKITTYRYQKTFDLSSLIKSGMSCIDLVELKPSSNRSHFFAYFSNDSSVYVYRNNYDRGEVEVIGVFSITKNKSGTVEATLVEE